MSEDQVAVGRDGQKKITVSKTPFEVHSIRQDAIVALTDCHAGSDIDQ
jgi:hypothetical protein